MPILIHKHCRITPEPKDGTRLLVMRFWPRGVRKDRFDDWLRDLAPSAPLLKRFWEEIGRANLDDIERENLRDIWTQDYIEEMKDQRPLIHHLRRQHEAGGTLTLLCGCHDPAKCHRSLLKDLIEDPDF